MDLGKLFKGGISCDTNEDRVKEYFKFYGEVVEAVIVKDMTTCRACCFLLIQLLREESLWRNIL
uniref:RRM domain-containing protein n=1 Tax=Nelumbo nucifera TaxID=4432 RepID=A0A822Y9R7_NELNU|nr:TPA_asm: hypothetical protein HUJ06_029354 [Nelumbo nucifera]